jgi:chemotaxis protein histidine kinase CheA
MADALRRLEKEPSDERARHRMLCLVHSLRGNARLFGFQELAGRAQLVEEIVLNKPLPWPPDVRQLLTAAAGAFRAIVPRAVEGGIELLPQEKALFEGLEQAAGI